MNAYEAKQEAKKEKFQAAAEKADKRADTHFKADRAIADSIPFGQPILVGHHSEGRHRRDLERMHAHANKMVEEMDKAKYYQNKADSVGTAGISSDDPEAVTLLREKLAILEERRDEMKNINAEYRKHKGNVDAMTTVSDKVKEGIKKEYQAIVDNEYGNEKRYKPIHAFQLTNIGANIRTIKKRIDQLLKEAARPETVPIKGTVEGVDYEVIENKEENRIQIIFSKRISAELFKKFRSYGWRYSRRNGAFQRHLNNQGRNSAKWVLGLD